MRTIRTRVEINNINSAVLVNSLPIAKSLNSSPKCLEGETFFSLNNISKNLGDEGLDDKNDKYETTNNHIFSEWILIQQQSVLVILLLLLNLLQQLLLLLGLPARTGGL